MVSKRIGRSHHKPTLFSGLNPQGLLDGGTGSKAFWGCQPSATPKTQIVPTNPQHQQISPQKSKEPNTSSVNSRNIPNSNVLQGEFTGIQSCYAPDQSQFLFVVGSAHPVQQNCSQLMSMMWCCFLLLETSPSFVVKGMTPQQGLGRESAFLLQHGGLTRRMEVPAGCICSPCHNMKREHSPSWCPGNSPESCKVGYRKLQVFL